MGAPTPNGAQFEAARGLAKLANSSKWRRKSRRAGQKTNSFQRPALSCARTLTAGAHLLHANNPKRAT